MDFLSVGVIPTGFAPTWYQQLCVRRGVHALTCCTHIFLVYIHCAYISHILHAGDAHAWLKAQVVCSAHVLYFDAPSPFSCITRLCSCCSLTVTSRPLPTTTSLTLTSTTSCQTFQTYKRRSSALRPRMSCLAIWPSSFLPHGVQGSGLAYFEGALIWTIYENLANIVKNYDGIIGQLYLID